MWSLSVFYLWSFLAIYSSSSDVTIENEEPRSQSDYSTSKSDPIYVPRVSSTFEPTEEWQDIEDGQSVPPGLYVRMNLWTGKKEARLLTEEEKNEKQHSKKIKLPSQIEIRDSPKVSHGEVEDSVTGGTTEPLSLPLPPQSSSTSESPTVRKLSDADREALKLFLDSFTPEDDMKRLHHYMEIATTPAATNIQIVNALEELEELVHQYDNAVNFIEMEGLELALSFINRTEVDLKIKTTAVWVLGTAFQNNIEVQAHALEKGVIPVLIATLQTSLQESNNTKQLQQLQGKLLYTLSAIIRSNAPAQQRFLEYNGPSLLLQILTPKDASSYSIPTLRRKTLSLVQDLLIDAIINKQDVVESIGGDSTVSGVTELKKIPTSEGQTEFRSMSGDKSQQDEAFWKEVVSSSSQNDVPSSIPILLYPHDDPTTNDFPSPKMTIAKADALTRRRQVSSLALANLLQSTPWCQTYFQLFDFFSASIPVTPLSLQSTELDFFYVVLQIINLVTPQSGSDTSSCVRTLLVDDVSKREQRLQKVTKWIEVVHNSALTQGLDDIDREQLGSFYRLLDALNSVLTSSI